MHLLQSFNLAFQSTLLPVQILVLASQWNVFFDDRLRLVLPVHSLGQQSLPRLEGRLGQVLVFHREIHGLQSRFHPGMHITFVCDGEFILCIVCTVCSITTIRIIGELVRRPPEHIREIQGNAHFSDKAMSRVVYQLFSSDNLKLFFSIDRFNLFSKIKFPCVQLCEF